MCLRCSPWPQALACPDTSVGLPQVEQARQDAPSLHILPSAIRRRSCKLPLGWKLFVFLSHARGHTHTHTCPWSCKPANLIFPWRYPSFTSLWISLPSDFFSSMEKADTIQKALFYKENRVSDTGNRAGCIWNEEMCVFVQIQPLNKGKRLLVSGLASLSIQGATCMIVSKNLPTLLSLRPASRFALGHPSLSFATMQGMPRCPSLSGLGFKICFVASKLKYSTHFSSLPSDKKRSPNHHWGQSWDNPELLRARVGGWEKGDT